MAVNYEARTYRLTGLQPMLGTQPANKQLHSDFILSKCPEGKEDANKIADYAEEEGRALTVFPVDDAGVPVILAYQVQGFFKEALATLGVQNNIAAPKKKVDNFLFIDPDIIYFYRDGNMVTDVEEEHLERPLRTTYMGTEKNVLASSEIINDPWEIEFTIRLLENVKKGSKSKYSALTWEAIEDALSYGELKGLGQWRNAGRGRFTWERIGDDPGKLAAQA